LRIVHIAVEKFARASPSVNICISGCLIFLHLHDNALGGGAFSPESLQVSCKKRYQHRRWQKNHLRYQRTCNARPC